MSTIAQNRTARPAEARGPVTRIEPSRGWAPLRLGQLWSYRSLVYYFTWRDVKVRYKQTVLGVLWAVLQPLLTMLVFSLFFGRLARIPSDGIPYPLFAFIGLVPWIFFANSINLSSNSLVGSANLIAKIYFPRLAVPVATVSAGLIDLGLSFALLLGMMAWYHVRVALRALWVVPFVCLAVLIALAVGLLLSALNVQFRDIRYIVPFLVQFWMLATPIAYPSTLVPERWRTLYGLNPMAGVIEGLRWALVGRAAAPWKMIGVSTAIALLSLAISLLYFRRTERDFADLV